MGRVEYKLKKVDVICQHKRDGKIIPMKLRMMDEDGEYQTYVVQAYKDLTHYGEDSTTGSSVVANHIWQFECKIMVFNMERLIKLYYNAFSNIWSITT